MPAAEYYFSREHIFEQANLPYPPTQTGDGVEGSGTTWNIQYPDGSHLVNSEGWNPGLQTLHNAEQKYSSSDPHSKSTWEGKGLQDLGDGYNPGERAQSWTVAQPGAQDDKVGSLNFPGGFAGDCGPNQNWIYDNVDDEWTCSGEPQWQQAVLLPEIKGVSDPATVGLLVMPYNWKDTAEDVPSGLNTYKEAWQQFHGETPSSNQNLDEIETTCYPDGDSFSLSFDGPADIVPNEPNAEEGIDYFHKIIQIDRSRNKPLPATGEVQMKSNSTYECRWKYNTQGGKQVHSAGSPVKLSNKEDNAEQLEYFQEQYSGLKTVYSHSEFKNYVDGLLPVN